MTNPPDPKTPTLEGYMPREEALLLQVGDRVKLLHGWPRVGNTALTEEVTIIGIEKNHRYSQTRVMCRVRSDNPKHQERDLDAAWFERNPLHDPDFIPFE